MTRKNRDLIIVVLSIFCAPLIFQAHAEEKAGTGRIEGASALRNQEPGTQISYEIDSTTLFDVDSTALGKQSGDTAAKRYLNRGVAASKAGQYQQAREQFLAGLALDAHEIIFYYQLATTEFNLENPDQAKVWLKRAHEQIGADTVVEQAGQKGYAELSAAGNHRFIPVSRDGWELIPKFRNPSNATTPGSYKLNTGSVYTIELEPKKSSNSTKFLSIPIGLLVVWVLAR